MFSSTNTERACAHKRNCDSKHDSDQLLGGWRDHLRPADDGGAPKRLPSTCLATTNHWNAIASYSSLMRPDQTGSHFLAFSPFDIACSHRYDVSRGDLLLFILQENDR